MSTSKNLRKQLTFDHLETRLLMAGDVSAVLKGETLKIIGDGTSNAIVVKQAGNRIRVKGIEDSAGKDTDVNERGSARFSSVDNVTIKLRDGDDYLKVRGKIPGKFRALTGAGDDKIDMKRSILGNDDNGKIVIKTHQGADSVDINRTRFRNSTKIRTGNDNDFFNMTRSIAFQNLNIHLGDDNNIGGIFASFLNSDLKVEDGQGEDSTISIFDTNVLGETNLLGEEGDDYVLIQRSYFNKNLNADMGAGERDRFVISASKLEADYNLDGGDGEKDQLIVNDVDVFGDENYNNFEVI